MKKDCRKENQTSREVFEGLEAMVRQKIQGWLQDPLDEELSELLGRAKSPPIENVDVPKVYRNGHCEVRKLTMKAGTIEVKRLRLRGDATPEQRFESKLLPLFVRRTKDVDEILPELYLHGVAEADFDIAVRGLLGEDAPVSPRVLARLKAETRDWRRSSRNLVGPVKCFSRGGGETLLESLDSERPGADYEEAAEPGSIAAQGISAVLWKRFMVVRIKFRRLKSPDRLPDVYQGEKYIDGQKKVPNPSAVAAREIYTAVDGSSDPEPKQSKLFRKLIPQRERLVQQKLLHPCSVKGFG